MEEWPKKWEEKKKREMVQKTEEGVAISAYTGEHQSTGLECSWWVFRVFMGPVSFFGITVTTISDQKHHKEGFDDLWFQRVQLLVAWLQVLSRPSWLWGWL